jgi:hypothetical protein
MEAVLAFTEGTAKTHENPELNTDINKVKNQTPYFEIQFCNVTAVLICPK